MARPSNRNVLLCFIAGLVIITAAITVMPVSATTVVQLQPGTVSPGDRVLVSANMARNGSTVTLSYYYDANKTGVAPNGASWVKIAKVTDGGANDSKNKSNGFILFSWMTPQFSPGQYIIKVEDPYGPTRTTLLTVQSAPLNLVPAIYGPNVKSDKGLIMPGNSFSVAAVVTGNCRMCHMTDKPTRNNPGVNTAAVDKLFSADLSQITGNPGDTSVPPFQIHHQLVTWFNNAGKTLATNQTISATVTGTNPAGNATTRGIAYAGVNTAVNTPPKVSTSGGTPISTTGPSISNASSAAASASKKSQGNPLPGFEAILAIAGLTAVAYLMSRKR